ncbi:hypothetical protein SAV14893_025410 [Streptomyces avermitilis]|uniref:Uncharacterized protein n=1 Tax=Streptomyces avermitilis TaxID=33903 RepID=A0A4D4LXG2_STRAX|nr:hypothetical protein SAV14893_025410 [Streptomyces avermitilis]
MDVHAVLVDEVVPHEFGGEVRAPSARSPPSWALRAWMSSTTRSRTMVVCHPACCNVRENTILGMSRQIRAKSATGPVLAGSASAVGQKSAMSW